MWCVYCGRLSDARLCPSCHALLSSLSYASAYDQRCNVCSAPVLDSVYPCPICNEHVYAYGPYEGILSSCIRLYKHQGQKALAPVLASLFETMLIPRDDILLVPIPSSSSGKRLRGFDQMALLASITAKNLKVPYLRMFSQTERQFYTLLGRTQRLEQHHLRLNDVNNDRFRRLLDFGLTPVILDDIYTTGNTARQAYALLQQKFGVSCTICVLSRA